MGLISEQKQKSDLCKELWYEYKPRIESLCRVKLASMPDEIDDVVAETYLALCENIARGTEIRDPLSWLLKVCNNLIIKRYDAANKEKERIVPVDLDEVNFNCPSLDILDEIINYDDIETMKDDIFSKLNEKEKKMIQLVYKENMKSREIAEIQNSSVPAIKQARFRINRKVKAMVKEAVDNFIK